ncbi:hypothetical protein HMPREF9555_00855 [Selenomonas artemidis F0399]|uniref:Uncharacterized protein n=1 Tax=Selenomonas artemidis F0399 TaxID=749551 RepID=E7N1K3_9FIRM|nr:hypothetical protein HMPREF9555_00855 [Selenomonas artemidis F0399]
MQVQLNKALRTPTRMSCRLFTAITFLYRGESNKGDTVCCPYPSYYMI